MKWTFIIQDPTIYTFEYYLQKDLKQKPSFELVEITESDVSETVKSLSNKSSTGPHGISNKILKQILPLILENLTKCINKM